MKSRFYSSLSGTMTKEMESLQDELQQKVDSLHSELELTILRRECKKYEARAQELQERLNAYEEKERAIADVLLNAQTQAQKIENQARERVRQMEARVYEDIRRKAEELAQLRTRLEEFMEEIAQMLHSMEYALASPDSNYLPNPVLFANTDFDAPDKADSPEDVNHASGSGNGFYRRENAAWALHTLKSVNLNPDIKGHPLRILPCKPCKD